MKNSIIWTEKSWIKKGSVGIGRRLSSLFWLGFKEVTTNSNKIATIEVYCVDYNTENLKGKNARKALQLLVEHMSPMPVEELYIFARNVPHKKAVQLAMVRKDELSSIRKKQIRLGENWIVTSPNFSKEAKMKEFLLATFLISSANLGYLVFEEVHDVLAKRHEKLIAEERLLRLKAVEQKSQIKSNLRWDLLEEKNLRAKLPDVVWERILILKQATPAHSHWTEVYIKNDSAELQIFSKDPLDLLDKLSSAPIVEDARFKDSLRSSGEALSANSVSISFKELKIVE